MKRIRDNKESIVTENSVVVVVVEDEPITVALFDEVIDYILLKRYMLDGDYPDSLFNLFYLTKILYPKDYAKIFNDRLIPSLRYVSPHTLPHLKPRALECLRNISYLEFEATYYTPIDRAEEFTRFVSGLKWTKVWHNLTELILSYCEIDFTSEAMGALSKLRKLFIGTCSRTKFNGHFSRLVNLEALHVGEVSGSSLCDSDFLSLGGLKHFSCYSNHTLITDAAFCHLTTLESLDLSYNRAISNTGLSNLLNYANCTTLRNLVLISNFVIDDDNGTLFPLLGRSLTSLNLTRNYNFQDNSLTYLTNLRELNISHSPVISDEGLSKLTKLERLDISNNDRITIAALKEMNNLTSLNLKACTGVIISDELPPPQWLTTLKEMNLDHNNHIGDNALQRMTGLRILSLERNTHITDKSIECLTQLTNLCICFSPHVTLKGLSRLSQLKRLTLSRDDDFDPLLLKRALPKLETIRGVLDHANCHVLYRLKKTNPWLSSLVYV